jgi:endoglycosylceramidase
MQHGKGDKSNRGRPSSFLTAIFVLLLCVTFVSTSFVEAHAVLHPTRRSTFLSVQETQIVDAKGQPVLFRGVNYAGYGYDAVDATIILHSESVYQGLAQLGFNVVRLPIVWANFEPTPGTFSDTFLRNYVDQDVQWAKKYGVYIVLDMHQVSWAARFGGNGAPTWAVQQYPQTKDGKYAAIVNFWSNATLQGHLINIWTNIASHYANEPTIAGYDIFNEPYVIDNDYVNGAYINSFQVNAANSIRSVDPNHIVFIEPANMDVSDVGITNMVWSPHFYPCSFDSTYSSSSLPVLQSEMTSDYNKFVVQFSKPMWIGEYGAFMTDGTDATWFHDAVALIKQYQAGSSWWAYYGPAGSYGKTIPSSLISAWNS